MLVKILDAATAVYSIVEMGKALNVDSFVRHGAQPNNRAVAIVEFTISAVGLFRLKITSGEFRKYKIYEHFLNQFFNKISSYSKKAF